jgi:hypothetical protein
MPFLKEDLSGRHYFWKEKSGRSAFNGEPSRRLFDPFDGEQVLFMINFYETVTKEFSAEEGRKLEELIITRLPVEVKSEISVFNWLKEMHSIKSQTL